MRGVILDVRAVSFSRGAAHSLSMRNLNVLAVPDLHIPFEHPDALAFVLHVDKVWFPGQNRIVMLMGDEVDSHAISRHMPDPNGLSPGAELEAARRHLLDWFTAFPVARICSSNHTVRPWKKAYESGIASEFMREVGEVYRAPATWLWADRWVYEGVVFEHGENVSGPLGALNAAVQNQAPTVIGHLHTFGGAVHSDSFASKLWGLNTGCLIDAEAYAFRYAKSLRKKPTLGCGVIKNGSPYFVPMLLGPTGRWIGAV